MSSTTHEEWADEEITTCATCRRDGARRCVGCNGAPDNEGRQLYPTYYCSTQCQKTDYIRTHKHACKAAKDRRAVYRVGDIAQLAFYAYSERLFDTSITKVEKKDDTLYLRQGKNDQNLLLPFPSKLFSNKDEKSAALTPLAHDNAIGFVHILIEKMVGKLIQRITRVDYIPKNYNHRIILVSPTGTQTDTTTQPHAILQITLYNDEQFAIDITGVQHGHATPIVPWLLYVKTRIAEIKTVTLLQNNDEYKKPARKSKHVIKVPSSQEKEFAAVVGGAVDQWETINGSVYEMIRLRDDVYKRYKTMLLAFIDERVKKHVAYMQNNGRLSSRPS